ncbi:hypothetical protein AB205_0025950, partial [Aquarana catesbeiana]
SGSLSEFKIVIKEEIKVEDGVKEESAFLKGHQDLYQDTMVESSSYRNPPERCPRPLYSRDSTQEGHTIPHHHQNENPKVNIDVKKEEDEEYGVMEEFSEGHKDMMEPPNTRNPPERCPRPLYSRDPTPEGHIIPRCYKSGDPIDIEFEVKAEEEKYVRDDQQSMEEDGITGTFIEEDTPTEISTDCKVEDEDITQYSPGENPTTSNKSHIEVKPFSCSVCGKCFAVKYYLSLHQTLHTGEKPYSCSECGKCFVLKSRLVIHQRSHMEVKPFSCSVCGKCFAVKSDLVKHQRYHTEQKQFFCSDCGKCFSQKNHLFRHQSSHTGEKPYSCSECWK